MWSKLKDILNFQSLFPFLKKPSNRLATVRVILVFLQVKLPLVKVAWSILFLEIRFYRVVLPPQRPPYVNWSMERDQQWCCTLKTRILRQERSLKTSHSTNLLNKVVVLSRSRPMSTKKVQCWKRLSSSGPMNFYR